MVVLHSHLGKREKSILGGFATFAAVGLSGVRLDCLGLASAHSNSCSASVVYNYHTYSNSMHYYMAQTIDGRKH